MTEKYGVVPDVTHYGCVVDMLGRLGHLEEAYRLVKSAQVEPEERMKERGYVGGITGLVFVGVDEEAKEEIVGLHGHRLETLAYG
ncbi:hypothetical protein L6164_012566 [Bauhinia variegata]|uniref:Uncharacterized protein n=1 Tax=Bauhinia variegata TaxID=167791 RepID=A0ACB9PAD1_BAUVA|nr:hypothetical protein L6164_012566 [Bauhinia variegata]